MKRYTKVNILVTDEEEMRLIDELMATGIFQSRNALLDEALVRGLAIYSGARDGNAPASAGRAARDAGEERLCREVAEAYALLRRDVAAAEELLRDMAGLCEALAAGRAPDPGLYSSGLYGADAGGRKR